MTELGCAVRLGRRETAKVRESGLRGTQHRPKHQANKGQRSTITRENELSQFPANHGAGSRRDKGSLCPVERYLLLAACPNQVLRSTGYSGNNANFPPVPSVAK